MKIKKSLNYKKTPLRYINYALMSFFIFIASSNYSIALDSFDRISKEVYKNINLRLKYKIDSKILEMKVIRNNDFFLFLDQDLDGTPDSIDNDIDGDGVDNIADEFPTLSTEQGEDQDKDGIADFIDFNYSLNIDEQERGYAAIIQRDVFVTYNILIIPAAKTNLKELTAIKELLQLELTPTTDNLKFIVLETQSKDQFMTRGLYEKEWKQLILYKNHLKDFNEFSLTLTHEYFHFIAQEMPELYNHFVNEVGWNNKDGELTYQHNCDQQETSYNLVEATLINTDKNPLMKYDNFPSDYSTVSPTEMFAEVGTAVLLERKRHERSFQKRFYKFDRFKSAQAYYEMARLLNIP